MRFSEEDLEDFLKYNEEDEDELSEEGRQKDADAGEDEDNDIQIVRIYFKMS